MDPTLSNVEQSNYIVLLDLPQNVQMLESVLRKTAPSRIYAHFTCQILSTSMDCLHVSNFPGIISFKNRPAFPLNMHLAELAKHTGWPLDALKFMTQVFLNLILLKWRVD